MENILKHRLAVQQNIEKGFNDGTNLNEELDSLEKARSGVYADTSENRKLARVGQQYGGKKQEDENDGAKIAEERLSIALDSLNDFIGNDKSKTFDLAIVKNQLNGIHNHLKNGESEKALKRVEIALSELKDYIDENDGSEFDLAIVKNQLNGIKKVLSHSNEKLEKARSGVYEDTAKNRKLNRVGQQYGGKKQEDEPKGEGSRKEKQDVSSYAKNASEGALRRAAADEKAPEDVRNAAKKELEKRGKNSDDKKWKSVFDKMKKVDGNFAEEMYDDLAELAQKHGVDYDEEGEESLKKLPIKEVEKIVNAYSNGGSY